MADGQDETLNTATPFLLRHPETITQLILAICLWILTQLLNSLTLIKIDTASPLPPTLQI